jgi:hypothetical protein
MFGILDDGICGTGNEIKRKTKEKILLQLSFLNSQFVSREI